MVDRPAAALSPIATTPPETVVAGWVVSARRSDAELTLADQSALTKVSARASWDGSLAATLNVRFGCTARSSWQLGASTVRALVVGAAPGEWLALAAPGQHAVVVGWLEHAGARADELVTVVDVTHGGALVRLTGKRAPALLAKVCGVDLDDAVVPDASALRSSVAGVATDVVRDDRDGTRSYLLHCERSSGQYLFDSLLDAGHGLGVEADGFLPPWI